MGIASYDYGARFGLSHYVGGAGAGNTLELELYYEHGMQDILKNVSDKQFNRSFGVSLLLSVERTVARMIVKKRKKN